MTGLVVQNKAISIENNLAMPTPKAGEVVVQIKYASVHSFDLENIEGKNDLIAKLMGAKKYPVRTGIEFSGMVTTDGARFKKGDEVFGYPDLIKGTKAHQQYIAINENLMAPMPANLGFEQSCALPVGALTSLAALEALGKVTPGANALINGAAGGLGVYAVQLAKILNATVTAVAGPGQEAFLKELGANKVVDYKKQRLQDLNDRFDVVFDLTAKVKFAAVKQLLKPKGVFVPANPFNALLPIMGNALRKKKVGYLMVDKGNYNELARIAQWVEQGKLKPIVDSTYPFADYQKAFDRTLQPNKRGRIVMKME